MKRISDQELILRVRKRTVELGRTPTVVEFKHSRLAIIRFKRWNTFLEIAGLDLNRRVRSNTLRDEGQRRLF